MGNFVKTFAYLVPVGFVIIMILGVGLAEQAGLFSAVIRYLIFKTPKYLITFVLALVGICAKIASDAGIVIAPAIGGAVFLALRRHPIAGVCAGYVAGIAFGLGARTIRHQRDVPNMMAKGLMGVSGFFVVCLPASMFIDLFHKSNLTEIIAVSGATCSRTFTWVFV